jgi:pimeloyl-ACP methyl ester carboxylesterase
MAGAYPDLVRRLVILNAPHLQLYSRALRRPGQLLRAWYIALFQVPGLAESVLRANDYRAIRRLFTQGPARPDAFTDEQVEQYVDALRQPGALTATLNYYRALREPGSAAIGRAARVECETLVIWGDRDRALSRHLLDDIESVAPLVEVHHIPDAGHWVQNEAPDEVNRMLLNFLQAADRNTDARRA